MYSDVGSVEVLNYSADKLSKQEASPLILTEKNALVAIQRTHGGALLIAFME